MKATRGPRSLSTTLTPATRKKNTNRAPPVLKSSDIRELRRMASGITIHSVSMAWPR